MGFTGRKHTEPMVEALPEFFTYRDDGCEVAPACLRCPLPQCRYDDPKAYLRFVVAQRSGFEDMPSRDRAIVLALQSPGRTFEDVAADFHLSPRTVRRVRARE